MLNYSYSEPVYVAARVRSISYEVTPALTLPCDTESVEMRAGTLEGLAYAEACRTELSGALSTTDTTGSANFSELALRSGPPGTYELEFYSPTSEGVYIRGTTAVVSHVGSIEVLNDGSGLQATPGQPLSLQPMVQVLDAEGSVRRGSREQQARERAAGAAASSAAACGGRVECGCVRRCGRIERCGRVHRCGRVCAVWRL